MTGFNEWMVKHVDGKSGAGISIEDEQRELIEGLFYREERTRQHFRTGEDETYTILVPNQSISDLNNEQLTDLKDTLQTLGIVYLTQMREKDGVFSPINAVEKFHVASNGAQLANFHALVDMSDNGMETGLGCMVNYRYDLDKVLERAEETQRTGAIPVSHSMKEKMPSELFAGKWFPPTDTSPEQASALGNNALNPSQSRP